MLIAESTSNHPNYPTSLEGIESYITALCFKCSLIHGFPSQAFFECAIERNSFLATIRPRLRLLFLVTLHDIFIPNFGLEQSIEAVNQHFIGCRTRLSLWSWIEETNKFHQDTVKYYTHRNTNELSLHIARQSGNIWGFMSRQSTAEYISYENILHAAVQDDYVECIHLLCASEFTRHRQEMNQKNMSGNTALHLAARDLKITHLSMLVHVPAINLLETDNCGRKVIDVLLTRIKSCWATQLQSVLNPQPKTVVPILTAIIERIRLHLPHGDQQNTQRLHECIPETMSLTIATRSLTLLRCLCDCVFKTSQWDLVLHNFENFYTRISKQVILMNRPDLVRYITTMVPKQQNPAASASLISFCVIHERARALTALLSQSYYIGVINFTDLDGNTPLQLAIQKLHQMMCPAEVVFHLGTMRALLSKGADPLCNAPVAPATHTQLVPQPHLQFGRQLRALPSKCDNMIALAAMQGSLHALRLLMSCIPSDTPCFPFPDNKLVRSFHSDSLTAALHGRGTEPHSYEPDRAGKTFTFKGARFKDNPLVFAVMGGNVGCLEYLLLHTSFKSLINFQDGHGFTPLSCAVMLRSIPCIELLKSYGADVHLLLSNPFDISSSSDSSKISQSMPSWVGLNDEVRRLVELVDNLRPHFSIATLSSETDQSLDREAALLNEARSMQSTLDAAPPSDVRTFAWAVHATKAGSQGHILAQQIFAIAQIGIKHLKVKGQEFRSGWRKLFVSRPRMIFAALKWTLIDLQRRLVVDGLGGQVLDEVTVAKIMDCAKDGDATITKSVNRWRDDPGLKRCSKFIKVMQSFFKLLQSMQSRWVSNKLVCDSEPTVLARVAGQLRSIRSTWLNIVECQNYFLSPPASVTALNFMQPSDESVNLKVSIAELYRASTVVSSKPPTSYAHLPTYLQQLSYLPQVSYESMASQAQVAPSLTDLSRNFWWDLGSGLAYSRDFWVEIMLEVLQWEENMEGLLERVAAQDSLLAVAFIR